MPLDLVVGLPAEERAPDSTTEELVAEMQKKAEQAYEVAREKLRDAALRRKAAYDIRVKNQKFNVGDWVWYWYPRRFRAKSPKWQKNYTGSFLIVRIIEPVNYILQRSARAKPFFCTRRQTEALFQPYSTQLAC
jgi:hypothetical protein